MHLVCLNATDRGHLAILLHHMDVDTISRQVWAAQMRLQFSPKAMLDEQGVIQQVWQMFSS